MIANMPLKKVSLDKLFTVCSSTSVKGNEVEAPNDSQILSEAVSAIATGNEQSSNIFNLYDPGIARVSRLFAGDTVASWLIRASGLAGDQDVLDAFQLASGGSLSVVDILTHCGKLSHSDVNAVIQAEALVTDGLIYRGFAAAALRIASTEYIEFEEALQLLDLHPNNPFSTNRLANLVAEIGLVSKDHLSLAKKESLSKGITIGWSLVKNDLIDEQLLKVLIECLFAVRDQRLDRQEIISSAILAISSEHDQSRSPEARLVQELDLTTLDRAFGNLLLASGIIGIEELLFCAEVAVEEGFSLEEVVQKFEIVEPNILNGACQLARMLLGKKISARDCTIMLQKLKSSGKPLAELLDPEEANRDTDNSSARIVGSKVSSQNLAARSA